MSKPNPKPPFIDRVIGFISPQRGAERAYYRAAMNLLPKLTPQEEADTRSYPRDYTRERDAEGPAGETSAAAYSDSQPNRLDAPWPTSRGLKGFNSPLNRWRQTRLRDRARQLDRDNALVTGMLDRATENVIGHGMRLRPTTADAEFNKQVEALWPVWLDAADLTGQFGAAEFQRLLHRSFLRDGDVGVNMVSRGNDAFLQAIEGDLIDTSSGGYDLANRIVNGIQFNEDNRATNYFVLGIGVDGIQLQAVPIPARNFVFYARLKNFSQVRGEPCFAQVDRLFDQVDGYVEASVIAARIAACQALIVKKQDANKIVANLQTQLNANNKQQRVESMEPGMVRYLQPGEEIQQFNPAHPTQSFPDFIATLLRFTGLTLGLPLELVFLDFSRTTYSSARASLLQSYRAFRSQQQVFIDRVMARIYRWRVSKWVKDGTLTPSAAIRDSYWDHTWIAPGWSWIDPQKEIQAAMMECDAGFNSLENVCLQHGRTMEDILAGKARAKELAEKLTIDLSRSSLTRDAILVPGQPAPGAPAPGLAGDDSPTDATPEDDE